MGPPGEAMPPPTAPGEPHDNGPAAPATALVTTGPDGAPLDEGSQQSTLSNASAGRIITYYILSIFITTDNLRSITTLLTLVSMRLNNNVLISRIS